MTSTLLTSNPDISISLDSATTNLLEVVLRNADKIACLLADASPLTKIGAGVGFIAGGVTNFLKVGHVPSAFGGCFSGGLIGSGLNGLLKR